MKFSVFTASTPEWTPEEAAAQIAEAGYEGVEWRVTDQPDSGGSVGFWSGNRATWPFTGLADAVPQIAEVTEKYGLDISSLGTYVRCDDPESVEAAMDAASRVGAAQLRVTLPSYDPSTSFTELRRRCREQYVEVARLAQRHGVRALVEIHHRTPVASPAAAAAFVGDFDPEHVGVIHDQGNMVYEGWTQYRQGLEELGEHLAHVHLKNGTWVPDTRDADGNLRWKSAAVPLREGFIDVTELLGALRAVGYDEWITFEDFSTELPLGERIRDNLVYTKACLAAVDES
jgi:sugar phosphate isomerase/epimerase